MPFLLLLGIGLYDPRVVASDGGPVRGEVGVTRSKWRNARPPWATGCVHERVAVEADAGRLPVRALTAWLNWLRSPKGGCHDSRSR